MATTRKVRAVDPLTFIDLLRAAHVGRFDRAATVRFVEEHRAQVEAHASGLPTRYGHDASAIARSLLVTYGGHR